MTAATDRLAIAGGEPVRTAPYPHGRGISLLGAAEIDNVVATLQAKALFRYGPTATGKADAVEAALRSLCGSEYALAVNSGTSALYLGLLAAGIEEGDEVIVPAVTFVATVGAVVMARAVPVFAEVDDSLTLDPASFEANVTERTHAVIPVHLDNVAADLDPIVRTARRHGITVIEDAAQASGVTYRGRAVGSIGDAGMYSFQQGKNITCGEGGALLTSSWDIHDKANRFHDQGGQFTTSTGHREHSSGAPFLGMNLRMSELSAAVLEPQLDRLATIVSVCRERARSIRDRLRDLPLTWRRIPDADGDGDGGSLIFFAGSAELAARFAQALTAEGVPAGRMLAGAPVYTNQAIADRRTLWSTGCPFHCERHPHRRTYLPGLCARSEDLFARSVIMGVTPSMTDQDTDDVVAAVRKVARHLC